MDNEKRLWYAGFMKKQMLILFGLLVSGAVSAWAFPPYEIIPILFLTFSMLFYALVQSKSKKEFFFNGLAFGFGFGVTSLFWINNALMIDDGAFVWVVPLCMLACGIGMGLFFAFSALCVFWGKSLNAKLVVFASTFTLFEMLRGWLFTGFPWNLLGSVWVACMPVLQTASVIGVYGLSFLSVFLFCCPVLFWKKQYKFGGAVLFVFLFIFVFGFLRLSENQGETVWGVKLRLVQPNIKQSLKWDPGKAEEILYKHIRMSRSKKEEKISHVIWAEAAVPYLLADDDDARALTISALNQGQVLITGALRRAGGDELANSLLIIDDVGGLKGYYDKSHLVPFGEYMPLRGILPISKVVPIGVDFKEGEGVKTILVPGAPAMGALVCYEVIFPGSVVEKNNRPGWLVNVTNDAWYGMSAGPYQHLAAAQLRAVEEGLPLVRATNNGISAIINPYGGVVASLPLGVEGVLDSSLPRYLPPTVYSRFGNLFPFFIAIFALLYTFLLNKKNKL